ncbi:MAG: PASTA domain-containing protein, partial [Abditibacteriota bacterium]|nr:PASTA domain-containing protein [Abditibacteriota bacterium]
MKKSLLVIMALALIVCFAVSAIGITKTEMPSKPKPGAAKKAPAKKKTVNTKAKKPAPAAKSDTKPVNRKRSTISKAEKGDVVTYGRYEQDGNFANGKEPIEWIVIGEDYDDDIGSYLTLISRYGLDARPYTDYNADITWENCSLRQWLNGKFLETAFIFAERGFMLTNNHNNAANSKYGTSGGGDTQDAVMLLPADYASGLFYSDASRSCTATKYAIGQGAEVNEKGLCWCWLSTPGESQDTAAVIDRNGAVNLAGLKVGRTNVAVRPVIYIERTDIDETLQAVEEYARQQGMTLEEFYAQQAAAAAAANSKKEDAAAAVPKVAGMGEAEAVSALEKAGFAVEKSDPAYSDEHPEGTVILQSPEAGSELKSGETVTIQVSLGKEFVVMPDVKGKSISDAEQMLAEAGLG